MADIVVIDDDRTFLHQVSRSLEKMDLTVQAVDNADDGLNAVRERVPDVLVLDLVLPGASGLDVFQELRTIDKRLPVIFITASGSSDLAIEAMQLGAFDYVTKPPDLPALNKLVMKALDTRRLMSSPVAIGSGEAPDGQGEAFVGRSQKMLEVFKAIGRVASQDVMVLIRGESGTGKELVARALYQHSHRSADPFMAVNCAALPDTLLESELFGHEKGAFTSADRRRIGKFEQCNGGTLFLDEVGDMSLLVQGKTLRVLQEQRFERIGGNETIETDVRIIAATNRDLETMVEKGKFRSDLLYRLNGVTISLPPVRERREDIPLLLQYFLNLARVQLNKQDIEGISPEAVQMLTAYDWPGNVRELQSVVRRSVLNANGPVIVPAFLPEELHASPAGGPSSGESQSNNDGGLPNCDLAGFVERGLSTGSTNLYADIVEMVERYTITRVLQATHGNQSKASEILGITRGKIRDRIATYGIAVDTSVRAENE